MSEEFYEDSDATLEDQVSRSKEIVIVEAGQPKSEILRTVVFPKKTHHAKLHDTTYTENVDIYKVKEVIRSEKLKKGDAIKVFEVPVYNEGSYRMEHEQGMSESPIIRQYKPVNPPSENEPKVLFLNVHSDRSGKPVMAKGEPVFVFLAAESVKSKERVLDALLGKVKTK